VVAFVCTVFGTKLVVSSSHRVDEAGDIGTADIRTGSVCGPAKGSINCPSFCIHFHHTRERFWVNVAYNLSKNKIHPELYSELQIVPHSKHFCHRF
jgi:hypothetical protein